MAPKRARSLDLQRDRTSVQYHRRLEIAGSALLLWCEANRCDLEATSQDPHAVNDLLINHLQHLYDRNKTFWWGPHSIHGAR